MTKDEAIALLSDQLRSAAIDLSWYGAAIHNGGDANLLSTKMQIRAEYYQKEWLRLSLIAKSQAGAGLG